MNTVLTPPDPREPVPSVPPVEKADGSPLRYGGLRTVFIAVLIPWGDYHEEMV